MIQSSEAEIDIANVPAATDAHTYHQVSLEMHMLSYRIKELTSLLKYYISHESPREDLLH